MIDACEQVEFQTNRRKIRLPAIDPTIARAQAPAPASLATKNGLGRSGLPPSAVTVGDLRDRLLHRLRFGEEAIELFVLLQPDDEEIF